MQKLDYAPNQRISDFGPELPEVKGGDIPGSVIEVLKQQVTNLRQYQKSVDLVVSGGASLVQGFDFRISVVLPGVRVISGRERRNHCWLGGSVAAGVQFQGSQGINCENFQEVIERGQIWSEW